MYWVLVSRGVVSGICLAVAKYWYDRRDEKRGRRTVSCADRTPGVTPVRKDHPQAAAAASAVQAVIRAARTATEAQAPGDRGTPAGTGVPGPTSVQPATDTPPPATEPPVTGPPREAFRPGNEREQIDDHQRVEQALAAGDLSSMNTLLEDTCDPVLRNRLLNRLAAGYYRLRAEAVHRAAFYRVAYLQIDEAPSIMDGIEEIGRPRPDYIEAFKLMAIALDEDGRQDTAIGVCELALSLGLDDGTKTGFEGRIARLKKRRMRADADRATPDESIH